jgi:ubiquinone/menaquinone biosynthesis C-methylase UbiE
MEKATNWKQFWDERSRSAISDFDFDHGPSPDAEIQKLAKDELLNFIDPKPDEAVFDAGCGTGGNMFLLHSKVKSIVGMDYSQGAVDRCQWRIDSNELKNANVVQGSITRVPLRDCSIDKVLCMSVLQYMDDTAVRAALAEFARILKDGGILILHVKNLSSLYLSVLSVGKHMKLLLGKPCKLAYYRTYGWYAKALGSVGFHIVDYNSFEFLTLPKMPTRLVAYLQKLELRNHTRPLLRLGWIRRHGAELKIKAQLVR